MITAPSFMQASITSQSGTTLPSIIRTASPRRTPWARRKFATWFERRESSANDSLISPPPSSTTHSATRSLPRAMHVEVVERPVEPVEPGPPEVPARRVVVGAVGEQEVPRFEEGR